MESHTELLKDTNLLFSNACLLAIQDLKILLLYFWHNFSIEDALKLNILSPLLFCYRFF